MTDNPTQRLLPQFVAHRGYSDRYPENTVPAIEAALAAGAAYVEFDVQLTADGVPVVLHDVSLVRTAGDVRSVLDLTLDELRDVDVSERSRLGGGDAPVPIPTLAACVECLAGWPAATAFVELKRESMERFGRAAVVEAAYDVLATAQTRMVVISFDRKAILAIRRMGLPAIGWVLDTWDDASLHAARCDAPDYLFCDRALLPAPPVEPWAGPWQWAVYDIDNVDDAVALAERGIHLVETRRIGDLLGEARCD